MSLSSDFAARRGRWRPTWSAGKARPIRRRRGRGPIATRSGFQRLIDLLVETSAEYLSGQVTAGAQVLQIFDSWAGSLPDDEFQRWVIAPTKVLVERVRARHPHVPIIGFPRGAGAQAAGYVTKTGVDGVGCDTAMPLALMAGPLADKAVVQGNLDPLLLVAGGKAMEQRVAAILTALEGKRFIFNLGHGIVPQTPPENVARLVELVRQDMIDPEAMACSLRPYLRFQVTWVPAFAGMTLSEGQARAHNGVTPAEAGARSTRQQG